MLPFLSQFLLKTPQAFKKTHPDVFWYLENEQLQKPPDF